MKDLAPNIVRKRFLLEGYYKESIDESVIEDYFSKICEKLSLRIYGKPIIFSPEGMGKEGNQGYDAFVPLIDSGISLYVWSSEKFLSCIIYTCKDFDEKLALEFSKEFFKIDEIETMLF